MVPGFLTAVDAGSHRRPVPAVWIWPIDRRGLASADRQSLCQSRVVLVDGPRHRGQSNNFGTTGAEPTHPELLDALALHFMESGWSTKWLGEIVLSRAYQRAQGAGSSDAQVIDPDNRLYWRGHSRRLSVESLRDAMLLVSGELDLAMGGSLIRPGTKNDYNYPHDSSRRSVYQPLFRNSLPALYDAFDFADASVSIGQRARSTVASQGLALMNDPWVAARAHQAAVRYQQLADDAGYQTAIDELYMATCGRSASEEERRLWVEILQQDTDALESEVAAGGRLVHALLPRWIFVFWVSRWLP